MPPPTPCSGFNRGFYRYAERVVDASRLFSHPNATLFQIPSTDAVALIDLSTQGAGKWIFGTRDVYLQLEPHWLGVLSASMMMPRLQSIKARLSPGFCPLSALSTGQASELGTDASGLISDALMATIMAGATNVDAAATYLVAKNTPLGRFTLVLLAGCPAPHRLFLPRRM